MLDAIEAGISALRSRSISEPPPQASSEAAVMLQAELRAAGISAGEFARLAGVPRDAVEGWTNGASAVPQWVSVAIRLVALLTPSARQKLLYGPMRTHASATDRTHSHPFSRIEEL
jgi:predicted transcriptional regulator